MKDFSVDNGVHESAVTAMEKTGEAVFQFSLNNPG